MAAMVNDMIYSAEHMRVHHHEGFPTKVHNPFHGTLEVDPDAPDV